MGFTDAGVQPWLPFGGRTDGDTVAVQREDPGSAVHCYRRLIEVRRSIPHFSTEALEWLEAGEEVVAYRRGDVAFVANISEHPTPFPLEGELLFSTTDMGEPPHLLEPDEARIIRLSNDGSAS